MAGKLENYRLQTLGHNTHTPKNWSKQTQSVFSMFCPNTFKSNTFRILRINLEGWPTSHHPNSALEYIYLTLPNQEKTTHSRHQAPALLLPVPVLVAAGISGGKSLLEGRTYLSWAAAYFKRRNGKDTVFPHSHGIHVWYIYIYKYVFMYIYIYGCFRK